MLVEGGERTKNFITLSATVEDAAVARFPSEKDVVLDRSCRQQVEFLMDRAS
jgi:hypothetical protein